jgi:hypothetical protein
VGGNDVITPVGEILSDIFTDSIILLDVESKNILVTIFRTISAKVPQSGPNFDPNEVFDIGSRSDSAEIKQISNYLSLESES